MGGIKRFQGFVQPTDSGGNTADPVGHVDDGGAHLLLCGGVKIAAGAAGNGNTPAPQTVDRVPQLLAPDGKDPLQFPAGGGAALARWYCRRCSASCLSSMFPPFRGRFPKKERKKEGAVRPFRKNGPLLLICLFFYASGMGCAHLTPPPFPPVFIPWSCPDPAGTWRRSCGHTVRYRGNCICLQNRE